MEGDLFMHLNWFTFLCKKFELQEKGDWDHHYSKTLDQYHQFYDSLRGITLYLCIIGIAANLINIIVLNRKNMISPTNAILTGLAVADMMIILSFIPFITHNYLQVGLEDKDRYSFRWMVFALFNTHFAVVNHTISIWLTVIAGIWRVMPIYYTARTMRWKNLNQAKIAMASTCFACIIFYIPQYIGFTVVSKKTHGNSTYDVYFSKIAERNSFLMSEIYFWLYTIFARLVPCVAMTGIICLLFRALYKTYQRHQRLELRPVSVASHDQYTKMLLVFILLSVLAEFPSAVLTLFSECLGYDFLFHVYMNLLETMEDLVLLKSAANFVVYYFMNTKFRENFICLFRTVAK